jgi:hypothetical protein
MRILIGLGTGGLDGRAGRPYGWRVFRRLLSRLGYEPKRSAAEAGIVSQLQSLAANLNGRAARFRTVSARAVLLEQRLALLEADSEVWERRAARKLNDPELAADRARICGRLEGQLQELRGELVQTQSEEAALRNELTIDRERFMRNLEHARRLGFDVSNCLLYVDLTRPARSVELGDLAEDEGREFVGRVIDSVDVH